MNCKYANMMNIDTSCNVNIKVEIIFLLIPNLLIDANAMMGINKLR